MQEEINQTWLLNRPPHEVWQYLTRPELIEQWLAKTDFQPRIGHNFRFCDKWGKVICCEVLEVNPFTNLSYSWQYTSAKNNKLFDSKVVWTLTPKEQGTELQLVHNGFISMEDLLAHNKGWNTCLERFQELSKHTSNANTNT